MINQGRVLVNRQVTRQGNLKVTLQDCVEMDGQVIEVAGEAYFMLNKPAGYECTTVGSDAPTVLDLLDSNDCRTRNLQIAGRLDKDTTGLVLLTSDGGWNHRITAPGKQFGKEYWVEVAESITDEAVTRIEQGLLLKGENKPTLPAQIERLSPTTALLTLHEGKYHQVKRMFAACNNRVVGLHRIRVGHIVLDPSLEPGEYRALTVKEQDLT